jgi:hypothetical protein
MLLNRKVLWTVLLATITTTPVIAQEVSAGVTGRITDPTGAAIVGATVTATEVDRRTAWPTETTVEGVYALPRIPAGTYEITVEARGFRTAVRPGIRLEINQRARLDIQMELGAVTETVEITGAPPLLQTEKTDVGSVISANTNVSLPLNGRNFINLTLLAPGVTTPNPATFASGQRTGGGGRPYVNGNREQANNFLLDGVVNNHEAANFTSYQPNVDAIQEFKMITNNASAEFGNFQGGIINVTLKSGTNDLHGSLFEFLRNDKLNANNWARNWNGNPRLAIRQSVFGGTIGGPVIPDKMFFFADYQGLRQANPGVPGTITVMPLEFRQGDFSRLSSERGVTLYNPLALAANGNRQPFPNNQIPANMMNVVARNLFSSTDLYPAPLDSALRFNQLNTSNRSVYTDQGDAKVDAKLSSKDDLSVRYSAGRQDVPSQNSFPLIFDPVNTAPFQNGVVNWTRTLSPTLVNELRVGVNRIARNDATDAKGLGNIADTLGIANGNDREPGLMQLQFNGGLATNVGNANIGVSRLNYSNNYQFTDNVTVVKGRHMMKTGFQLLRSQMNVFYAGNNGRTGFFRYTGQFTSGPNPNAPARNTGIAEADFFLGYPARLGRGLDTGTWGHRTSMIGAYFQDDWRITDSLTLNLGLRWEYHTPLVEVKDRQSNFSPYTGELLLAGQDGNSRALYDPFRRDWQPRVGFAWTPAFLDRKTVLRGAYTISSFMEGTGVNLRLPLNPPFNTEFETIYEGQVQPGTTTDQGLILTAKDPFKGLNVRLWDQKVRPANVQQWSFLIERQLPAETVLSIGYVGQHGTHLVVPMPYFQKRLLPDGTTQPSPFLAGNPQLKSIAQISGTATNGNQRYDSLQLNVRKRLTAGLEYLVSYTWSKTMTDSIGFYGSGGQAGPSSAYWQNLYDQKSEWGPSFFDVTHNFTFSFVYDLPLGHNKAFGGSWHPAVDRILGNWQLGGILTLRGGFPMTVRARDLSGTVSRGPRADRIGDGKGSEGVGPGAAWFDTAAFVQPVAGTFGNSGSGVVRGPGMRNFDLSLQKVIPITESKRFELRGEFFNLTNTPLFQRPDMNVFSATFAEILSSQSERQVQLALKFYF